jgi:hypothetical protein
MTQPAPPRPAWPVGAVLFAVSLALAAAGYAAQVSADARGLADTILIVPAAAVGIVALALCVAEDVAAARRAAAPDPAAARAEAAATRASLGFMALLVAYVAAIPYAGFDAATFVFLAAALAQQGERRPLRLLAYAGLVAAPVTWLFVDRLGVRLPTLLF